MATVGPSGSTSPRTTGADELLARVLALLIGFVLDQQVSVRKAFSSPLELTQRIGPLDAERIAAMDPAELEAAFRERPALHRFGCDGGAGAKLLRDPRGRLRRPDGSGPKRRRVRSSGAASLPSPGSAR